MIRKLSIFLLILLVTTIKAQSPLLFSEVNMGTRSISTEMVGAQRSRAVTITDSSLLRSPTMTLNLFDDVVVNITMSKTEARALDEPGYIWLGQVEGEPASSVVLIVGDSLESGQIILSQKTYNIVSADNSTYTITEIDPTAQHNLLQHDSFPVSQPPSTLSTRTDSGEWIDVLVVYTQNAKAIAGGTTGKIRRAIENAVSLTNSTFAYSGVSTRLHIVHMQEVFYLEQPNVDFDADLNNLTGKTEGYMDEIHPLRDQYGADLVVLIAGTWFNTYCGTAWLPVPLNENYGFSITEARCLSGLSFAHQIGHNMGSAHDRANADQLPVAPYAYGYQDPATAAGDYADFVTIMALNTGGECPAILTSGSCPVIPRWSNPDQLYQGKPLGVPVGDPEAAHNVLSLTENAVTVANYRAAIPRFNLLTNGNFEINADKDSIPDFWTSANLSAVDGIVCNTTTTTVAYSGNCALRLGRNSALKQVRGGASLVTGDVLDLTLQVKRNKVTAGGFIRVTVQYSNTPNSIMRLNIPAGTGRYTFLSRLHTLKGTARKIIIELIYQGTSGKIILDDVRLTAPLK